MERMLYWLKKIVKRNKQCRCFCGSCEYYDMCKADREEEENEQTDM